MSIICSLIQLYVLVILARIVLSWFPASGEGGLASVQRILYSLTEPVLAPIRSLLPPLRMGAMGFDLSPIVVIIGAQLLIAFICG